MSGKRSDYHHGNLRAAFEAIAWETVRTRGADALSLRACAREAGVDPAAIYRHFKSKEDILNALTSRAFQELAEGMVAAEATVADAERQLMEIGMAYVRYARSEPHIFRMMFDQAGRAKADAVMGVASDGRYAYQVLRDGWARLNAGDPAGAERFEFALWTGSHGVSSLLVSGLGPEDAAAQDAITRIQSEFTRMLPLLLLAPGGPYTQEVNATIHELERIENDTPDGRSMSEEQLLRRLRMHREAIAGDQRDAAHVLAQMKRLAADPSSPVNELGPKVVRMAEHKGSGQG